MEGGGDIQVGEGGGEKIGCDGVQYHPAGL